MGCNLSTYRVFIVFVLLYVSVLSAGMVLVRREGPDNTYAFIGSEVQDGEPDHPTMIQHATVAHEAMQKIPGGNRPSVMAALWTDNGLVYFGSSMAGKGVIPEAWVDQRVADALEACENRTGGKHRCNGMCGEINVLSAWYQWNKRDLPQKKLIVAVTKTKTIAPCTPQSTEPGFGCKQFLAQLNFTDDEIIKPNATLEWMEPVQNVLGAKPVVCYI